MSIDPVIPGWWDGFRIIYRHGESVYEVHVENPDHCERGVSRVEMDGEWVPGGKIPLGKELVKHRIVVRMGKESAGGSPGAGNSTLPYRRADFPR